MNTIKLLVMSLCIAAYIPVFAQITPSEMDSIYIKEIEAQEGPAKVLHAEPLYIDLIRDLGARKGEREWNLGMGLTDNLRFDEYEALIEYEWAPMDRLGLEVELPFTFYSPLEGVVRDSVPSNRLNSIKIAGQWTFFVSEAMATSMAVGYINEFELNDFRNFGNPMVIGNVYNPFLIVAKRWGNNFHTLAYTGPMIAQHFDTGKVTSSYDINSNVHYMISGTRNFVGIEFNKTIGQGEFEMTMRPQMRLGISDHLLLGIVGGIPIGRDSERFSTFVRLIWEPPAKKH